MEKTKESVMKKGKRQKSATRYPKRMPTYVVAFAVQETHDEPPKPVPHKRSIENISPSAKSISPTASNSSVKSLTITPTETLSHVLDVPTISEVKIDILDDNQCGDIEKKSPQISNYIVVDNRMADEQPEIIFNASKHIKRCKDTNKFPRKKKPKKNKRVIKLKNVHFKYKNKRNNISRRLEKYYAKVKMNSPNAEQMQKQIYSNVLSKVVSRSRVLKKVLAKENLLDDTDRVSYYDGISINDYDNRSLNSSPSTTKKSYESHTSQNTLMLKSSSSSRNDDFYSIKTENSVIQVSSDVIPCKTDVTPYKTDAEPYKKDVTPYEMNVTPFKTDILNVAIAVAFKASKPDTNQTTDESVETLLHKENLTSDEKFLPPNIVLTSQSPSRDSPEYMVINYSELNPLNLDEKQMSNNTLIFEKKSLVGVSSDDDTFVIARTSSEFNKSSINSEFTLSSCSDTTIRPETMELNLLNTDDFEPQDICKRVNLLDTVINLGFYPTDMAPSTSSGANLENNLNDTLITENFMKGFPLIPKNKGDLSTDEKNNLSNILRKTFDVEKSVCPQKNISLPDDATIKAKLNETEKAKRQTYSEEVRSKFPIDLAEMWERLTLVLDLAVKRLEETLAAKIVKDITASLAIFNKHQYKVPKLDFPTTEPIPALAKTEPIKEMLHKEVFAVEDHLKAESDECVQCDLVKNQVIDQLMLKLSVERPKSKPTSTESLKKIKRPEIVKEYIEVLKPPAVDCTLVEVGRGDTVTVATATAEVRTEEEEGSSLAKILLSGPMAFIRENMIVITSVPTFFIVLFCLYGIIVIIMKP